MWSGRVSCLLLVRKVVLWATVGSYGNGVLGVLRPLWHRGLTCRAEARHLPPEFGRRLWHQVTQRETVSSGR